MGFDGPLKLGYLRKGIELYLELLTHSSHQIDLIREIKFLMLKGSFLDLGLRAQASNFNQ